MTAADKIEVEIAKYEELIRRKSIDGLWEDQKYAYLAFKQCQEWMKEDKAEAERIELEALAAEEFAKEEKRRNDPNYKTRELFKNVHINVPSGKDKQR